MNDQHSVLVPRSRGSQNFRRTQQNTCSNQAAHKRLLGILWLEPSRRSNHQDYIPQAPACMDSGTQSTPASGRCTTVTCLLIQCHLVSLDSEYFESRDWTSVSLIIFLRITIISSSKSLNSITGNKIIPILHLRTLRLRERLTCLNSYDL